MYDNLKIKKLKYGIVKSISPNDIASGVVAYLASALVS